MRRHLSALVGGLRRRRSDVLPDTARAQRGQVLPLFVLMSVVLLGGAALLTDVVWWWTVEQRMQRAADAGALAGSIYLPGDQTTAFSTAIAEVRKNGFINGTSGIVVTPRRDASDPRKLIVDVRGPVSTNFAKVFCVDGGPCLTSVNVAATGAAIYVMPVPMGSPQNYYGVGFFKDAVVHTNTVNTSRDTTWKSTSAYVATPSQWANPDRAYSNNDTYTTATATDSQRQWRVFSLGVPSDASVVIRGLEVRLSDVFLSSLATSCKVGVEVSWDNGTTWSTRVDSANLGTTTTADQTLGGNASTAAWGAHTFVPGDFTDANFLVRLTRVGNTTNCPTTRTLSLDHLETRVTYTIDVTTTTTTIEEVPVEDPDGNVLAPQNFWAALQSQGAPNIQGDAYMTYYDTRTSVTNDDYDPDVYYQYAIEMDPAASAGEVWVFDPGMCQVDTDKGTGENYTKGGANGSTSFNPVSTYYDLWDTHNTPYEISDDSLVYSSGTAYRRLKLRDSLLDVDNPETSTGTGLCDSLAWHNDWVQLASGLMGGHTYRLHTYSTDPTSATDQRSTTALNSFAIWSTASGAAPRVYGLGTMEAYIRLPGGQSSEFYLSQIDEIHAGKTLVIRLWDPGDTGSLAANLQILAPTTASYVVSPFNYTAAPGSGAASACASRSGTGVTSVITNTGGTSLFNGCWLEIEIPLDLAYTAPHPSSDSVTSEGGWWKIRYNMSGATTAYSTDLTTWQVEVRGNPVHLVME